MTHWFQTWDRLLFLEVPLQARFRQPLRNCHAVHDGHQRPRLPPNGCAVIYEHTGDEHSTPQVSIRGDNAGTPGETALYISTRPRQSQNFNQLITFTTPDEVTLQPNY